MALLAKGIHMFFPYAYYKTDLVSIDFKKIGLLRDRTFKGKAYFLWPY